MVSDEAAFFNAASIIAQQVIHDLAVPSDEDAFSSPIWESVAGVLTDEHWEVILAEVARLTPPPSALAFAAACELLIAKTKGES